MLHLRLTTTAVTLLALSTCLVSNLSAEKLNKIIIEGRKRIPDNSIIAKLKVQRGEHVSQDVIKKKIKDLYATGWFSSVDIVMDKGVLKVSVQENPTILRFELKKGSLISKEDLEEITKKLGLTKGKVFNESSLSELINMIRGRYRQSGYPDVKIEKQLSKSPGNQVIVTVTVLKHKQMYVDKLELHGNKHFGKIKIQGIMGYGMPNVLARIIGGNYYSQTALDMAKNRLIQFYQSQGYLEFKVVSMDVKPIKGRSNSVALSISVDEGPLFKVSTILIEGQAAESVEKLDFVRDMRSKIKANTTPFSNEWLHQFQVDLLKVLEMKHQSIADISADVTVNNAHEITVTLKLKKGIPITVRSIQFVGNSMTLDRVLRREMAVSEGESFTNTGLIESIRRLNGLGYLKNITPQIKPGENRTVDIEISVEEAPAASANLDFGWSDKGPQVSAGLTHPNVMGTGNSIKAQVERSVSATVLSLGGYVPFVFNNGLGVNYSLYYSNQEKSKNWIANKYSEQGNTPGQKIGAELGIKIPVTEYQSFALDTVLNRSDLKPLAGTKAKQFYEEFKTRFWKFSTTASWAYDSLNHQQVPSSGQYHEASLTVAPSLNKDFVSFAKIKAKASSFHEMGYTGFVLNPKFTVGVGQGYTQVRDFVTCDGYKNSGACSNILQELPPSDRFFGGEEEPVRGVMNFGDKWNNKAAGGSMITTASLNLFAPPIMDGAVVISGFIDGGYLYAQNKFKLDKWVYSTGLQMRISTPIAPITLILAAPIRISKGSLSTGGPDVFKKFQFSFKADL